MRADLHCHTKVSDGSMTPGDLIDYAARIGLDCIAVTDHDSMAGTEPAQARAKHHGIRFIPGIEVSTYDYEHGKKAHLQCYAPVRPGPLLSFCGEMLVRRNAAALEIIEKVAAKYPVDLETVKKCACGSAAVYKQHVAIALMNMGYSVSVFGALYSELFSTKTGWARVEPKYPDTRDAMKIIKETGGVAVLSHPGVYNNFDIIDELYGMGLDGIEVCHPRQSADDEAKAREAAKSHGLLMTGGSDFHGMSSARVNPLASRMAPEEELPRFLSRLDK
ncbi:MAG: PHP domain-containing protein [Clostridia bacterium]|nr:PHP domain-containing protein [Clostridia bacterium]